LSTISEKLFNRQLRFEKPDGDTFSDWRIQKLGDFMTIPDKIPILKIDKNKLLTVKLHLKGVMKNDSTESLSTQGTVYYVRRKGQFVYGKQNLFNGALGLIPDEYDGFLSSNDVPTLDINCDKINPFYLLYYIGCRNYYVPLESLAIGSGSKRIHESTVLNLEIVVPTLEEQSIIVSAICSIDKKIEIETFVLKGLNSQKQYLLSNLFV
jgi:type I restriction enzyme S subunit